MIKIGDYNSSLPVPMPANRRTPVITLLTDFGLKDQFVGVMKGVIASIAPRASVIDVSHEIDAYQVSQARFLLGQSWPYFPKGTVHVCVVDPGVGSARRPILVEAAGHHFVGPDNGLFTDLLDLPKCVVRALTKPKYWLKNISQTFHGRDVFSPVAAHLATGVRPLMFGPIIDDPLRGESLIPSRLGRRVWLGTVLHVDRFGNLITNLIPPVAGLALRVGLRELVQRVDDYAAGPPGEPVVLIGSHGNLEVAVNQGSAAKTLGCGVGSPVELEVLP